MKFRSSSHSRKATVSATSSGGYRPNPRARDHAPVLHRLEVPDRQADVAQDAADRPLELGPLLLGEPLLELEVHQGLAVLGLADVQDPTIRPSEPRSTPITGWITRRRPAPGIELLGDRVVQERIRGADLDHVPALVAVLQRTRFEHSHRELVRPPSVGQLEGPDDHAEELLGRSLGDVLRRQPLREGDANALTSSARSFGTLASMSSSSGAGRAPAVTSSVVLTQHMVPVPEQASDLRLQAGSTGRRMRR